MKIAFLGTSDFAATALKTLAKSSHQIVQVYAKEPKKRSPAGALLAVEQLALEQLHLPCQTISSLKKGDWVTTFTQLEVETIVVADFGLIIPENLLSITKYGILNIHPSLLPRWRGAAPLQRSILAGDTASGVSIIQVGVGIDDGPLFRQASLTLPLNISAQQLSEQLAVRGAELMIDTLNNLDHITSQPQATTGISYADKIDKSEGRLDFTVEDAVAIDRRVRALGDSISVYFIWNGECYRVTQMQIIDPQAKDQPAGTILNDHFHIQCSRGIVQPLTLQRSNKKLLPLVEFLRGYRGKLAGEMLL